MNPTSDYYKLLGIDVGASQESIRQAYMREARKWHPDKRQDDPNAENTFKLVKKAYETLSDSLSKSEYDSKRDDDDDSDAGTIFQDMNQLTLGKRPSQLYEEKINKYIDEYPNLTFYDNCLSEMKNIKLEILEEYKHEATTTCARTVCPVCFQYYDDLYEHTRATKHDQNKYLQELCKSTSLNDLLASLLPDIWSWLPVEPLPLNIKNLWLNSTWSSFESIVHRILPAVNILKNREDPSIKSLKCIDFANAEKVVRLIHCPTAIIHDRSPNLLTQIIDQELQIYQDGNDVNSTDHPPGKRICVVKNSNRNYALSRLEFVVQSPPIKSPKLEQCSSCLKSFGLFRWRYWCYMCGKNQCSECHIWQTCRHLGFVTPVRVCRKCSPLIKSILIDTIFQYIQQLLNNISSNENLMIYIHLLRHYREPDDRDNQLYKRASDYFLLKKEYKNAIQCLNIMSCSLDEYINIAEMLCSHSEYLLASSCFETISKRYRCELQTWKLMGNDYLAKDNVILALLSYQQSNISIEEIWLQFAAKKNLDDKDLALFIFYTKFKKDLSKQTNEWATWLCEKMKLKDYMILAVLTLQLLDFPAEKWIITLNSLSNENLFTDVALILRLLDGRLLNEIYKSAKNTNQFLQFAVQLLVNGTLEHVEKSMMSVNYQADIQHILLHLALIHAFHRPDWLKLRDMSSSTKQIERLICCTKVSILLQLDLATEVEWIQDGLKSGQSVFYLLEPLLTKHSYMELAEYHAKSAHIEVAINYYMLAVTSSTNTMESVLLSASYLLPSSEIIRCYTALFKHMRNTNVKNAIKALESIVDILQAEKKSLLPVLAAILLTFEKSDDLLFRFYVQLLEEISKKLDENFALINAIHHSKPNVSTSTKSWRQIMQSLSVTYNQFLQSKIYQRTKSVVYESIITLAITIRDISSIDVLKRIQNEYFGNRDLAVTPGEYRARLHLIECMIAKLEQRNIDAVGKLNEALAVSPTEDTITAITVLTKDPSLHLTVLKDLLKFAEALPTMYETDSFTSTVPSPPTTFSDGNLLKMNPNLIMIRKYERAILKYLKDDSLKSALSYIDLCQSVHDPTCIVSNWTLACLYFYDLLSKANISAGKEAEVYAYRNVINELVCQAFLLSSVYLPPHMQIYIFRLLIPIITETAKIFQSSISRKKSTIPSHESTKQLVLPKRESQVIHQLLKFTIHLTKVSPLVQLPTLHSFDVIYREVVGRQFLVRFLEVMLEQDTSQFDLYEYYLFEGVWQGWATNHKFDERRHACMEALLFKKHWDMFDVQLLLDIPLIPRTNEGWFYPECRPLVFSSNQHFARVDGIEFDKNTGQVQFYFQPATITKHGYENALFDAVDIMEIFQLGLAQAIFTLDEPNREFHAHPFQEMKYMPSSLLGTQYLATLLHTDYLLKMFTTGNEVCVKPPFEMRSIDQGLMKRLPAHLQEKMKPLHKCDKYSSFGRAHRFWIEADDVIYEHQETATNIIFRVADVRLRVHKHLLIRNSAGELIDAESESEEEKFSAESVFAQAFTDNYDEIGKYFPELLRLKELLKLSALYVFTRAHYQCLSKPIDPSHLRGRLVKMRNDFRCVLLSTDTTIEEHYDRILQSNGVYRWQVSSEQAFEVRSKIRQALEEAKLTLFDNITQNLCKEAHITPSDHVKSLVKANLQGSDLSATELAKLIANGITAFHTQLQKPIEKLGIRLQSINDSSQTFTHQGDSCNWVPAVFLKLLGSGRRIYGGVNLQLKLIEGHVPKTNNSNSYNANALFSNQSSAPMNNSMTREQQNSQLQQNMKHDIKKTSKEHACVSGDAGSEKRSSGNKYSNTTRGSGGDEEQERRWHRYGGKNDTRSATAREAHRLAKDQNNIPRSAQPIYMGWEKDTNPEARTKENPNPEVRLYTYLADDGCTKIDIRHDTPRTYAEEGGIGAQGPHANAGPHREKLRQHHWYGEQPGDKNKDKK